MPQKIELTSDECYSVAETIYYEWKNLVDKGETKQSFEEWIRIKNLKPAGNIPRFMLK